MGRWWDVSLSLLCCPEGTKQRFFHFLSSASIFILKSFHTSQLQTQLLFCLQETQNSYSIPEKNPIFLSLTDTSPCSGDKLLLSGGEHPSFFTWFRSTFSCSAKHIWEQPGPDWSKSEPLSMYPVCKACQTWLLVYQTFLGRRGGRSLIWGVPWNQQGMCAGGKRKLNGSAVALLWPVQGILGQSLLGFEKRNRKTNGFYQFRWGVIHQPGAWIAVSDTGESQDVLLRKSQALLIFNQLTSWAELSNNLHWRFPKPDQIMVSIPT